MHNIVVPNFQLERSLLICLLLNAMVFGAAWFFSARRVTSSRSQALLDALLIGYGVQYVSVGLPGMLGCLDFRWVCTIAIALAVGLLAAGWGGGTAERPVAPLADRLIVGGAALFVIAFVLAFAHSQADLPVISNDALTYHFPAAVQWMQQRRIGLFPTWFFNPANTYSPLAGSIFITWLMLPFGNDLLARFVEVPALLCVGVAIFRLCREIGIRTAVAGLVAAAAFLSRPIFTPCMMGKDDLFVAFFFISALVAISPRRTRERLGAARLGIAIGLLLATKYTTLLSVPMLALAFSVNNSKVSGEPGRLGPVHFRVARLHRRQIFIATSIAMCLAGPWYCRNWFATGNPLFPLAIPHLFRGLFTTSASLAFHTLNGAITTAIGGRYSLPMPLVIVLIVTTSACLMNFRSLFSYPILRTCVIGPIVGLGLFYWRSPFPEVRFLLPVFLLLFASGGYAIDRMFGDIRLAAIAAMMLVCLSLLLLFDIRSQTAYFAAIASVPTGVAIASYLWAKGRRLRWGLLSGVSALTCGIVAYVNWTAYCRNYFATTNATYSHVYADLSPLWGWVNDCLPADAVVAYTNLYYVYPLQGTLLERQLIYVPTRAGVITMADLPWLGDQLPGERIVPAAAAATAELPDRAVWLANLKKHRCEYLIIGRFGHGGVVTHPPEAEFAATDPIHFTQIFSTDAGDVYSIQWSSGDR